MADHGVPRAAAPTIRSRRRYARRAPRFSLRLPSRAQQLEGVRGELLGDSLRERVGDVTGASTAMQLIASALEPTTFAQYGRLFGEFAEYCEREGCCALPASPWTVVAYVGYLAEGGRWAATSLQPVFSAINRIHRDLGLHPPAKENHFLTAARQGMARAQVALGTVDSRVALPASAMLAIVADGEREAKAIASLIAASQLTEAAQLDALRGDVALSIGALFSGRQDSCVHLRSDDFGADTDFIWLRLTEKGKRRSFVRRIVRLPLRRPAVRGHESALPRIAAIARAYLSARVLLGRAAEPEWLLQLPGERRRPLTRDMSCWLGAALERCGISAPPGFAYQGHSIRSGGVSAQAAIGVERHLYVWLGGWARGSATVDKHYIDPTVLPTAAAYELYGWALARQFSADAGVVVAATTLPDPLDGDVSSDDSDEAERPPPLPLPRAAAASAARVHPPLPRRQRTRGARAPAPDSSADSEEVPYSQRWAARWLGTARA